ncbi:thioesterase [bacterium 1XD42-8]|jgi:predicted thioesterase|nr:thioesterase family protein [Lachnospiraceae bacterium]RKJ48060.1 thioesterase [bacterium 1XD42-8]
MLKTGIIGKQIIKVTEEMTAEKLGSGKLPVYATPNMITLIENTASASVEEYLEEGQGTVGTFVNVKHLAATPIGMSVTCETELTQVDRKRLVFETKVYDESELIGEGIHERFIIDKEKFMKKAEGKK